MKYFENLPKKSFTSSIGDFIISDFFTYLDPNLGIIDETPVTVDSKTTLLEAAYSTYGDLNSFWMFVSANETINPFTLLATNTTIFLSQNEAKTSLELVDSVSGVTNYAFPKGSLIAPYVANIGGSYSYSSVGNFNLNGPLSIIESVSYFKGTMIIKDQRGATFSFINQSGITGSQVVIIYPTEGGTYAIQTPLFPTKTKSAVKEIVELDALEVGVIEEFYGDLLSPTKSKSKSSSKSSTPSVPSIPLDGITNATQITATRALELQSKNITAYIPEQTGILKSLFVTAKYK